MRSRESASVATTTPVIALEAEFVLGLADLVVKTLGTGSIPPVQERVAEMITHRDTLRACLRAAEADAAPNEWGVM